MCGRYSIYFDIELVEKSFDRIRVTPRVREQYKPSYNVCPGDLSLVISSENPQQLDLYRFGFTPGWSKSPIINAKSEGIIKKKTFMKSIRSRWCLILANMFVEGTKEEGLNKPYKVWLREQEIFCLGGIWDEYENKKTGEKEKQFVIITLEPNELMQKIGHHRMPLILHRSVEDKWLRPRHLYDVTSMITQFPTSKMNAQPITTKIKYPKIKDISVLEPTGKPLYKEYDYQVKEKIKIEGFGRRNKRSYDDDAPGWGEWARKRDDNKKS